MGPALHLTFQIQLTHRIAVVLWDDRLTGSDRLLKKGLGSFEKLLTMQAALAQDLWGGMGSTCTVSMTERGDHPPSTAFGTYPRHFVRIPTRWQRLFFPLECVGNRMVLFSINVTGCRREGLYGYK